MPNHTDDGDQYHFRDIRPGDIVQDLGQMGWPRMRIVRQEADSVADYIEGRGTDLRQYEKNALAGCSLDDRVFLATFLTETPYKSAKTHYPVPESRLAKQDLMGDASHIADEHDPVWHPADQAVFDFLTAFLAELKTYREHSDDVAGAVNMNPVQDAIREVAPSPELADAADDLSHAIAQDRQARATTDEGDTDDDQDQDELGDFEPA